jgi:hypothetical protein
MFTTTQSAYPIQTIFGAGFIPEGHSDGAGCNLATDDTKFTDFVSALASLIWGETVETKH